MDNVHDRNFERYATFCECVGASVIAEIQFIVPAPQFVDFSSNRKGYRYVEKTVQQALFLKCLRISSALQSLVLLARGGLSLDAGAIVRILEELHNDVLFLAGPLLTNQDPEPRHVQYLEEFFQEEFDHDNPLEASQSRNSVSRKHILAFNRRTFGEGFAVDVSVLSKTLEKAFSGYIYGAACHVMDIYDGETFHVPLTYEAPPAVHLRETVFNYFYRSLCTFAIAARACDLPELMKRIVSDLDAIFDREGRPVPQGLYELGF